jgi:hypothetical protein
MIFVTLNYGQLKYQMIKFFYSESKYLNIEFKQIKLLIEVSDNLFLLLDK